MKEQIDKQATCSKCKGTGKQRIILPPDEKHLIIEFLLTAAGFLLINFLVEADFMKWLTAIVLLGAFGYIFYKIIFKPKFKPCPDCELKKGG